MAVQCDSIGGAYDDYRKMPGALFEKYNIERTMRPFLDGATVLDLACGSGHYSNVFVSLGASKVVGVDISPGMISNARAASATDKVSFLVGDCAQPMSVPGGPFDIVFEGWLLNYARDKATMTTMFRNLSSNLRDGGHFFGIMQYLTEDPRKQHETWRNNKAQAYDYMTVEYAGDVADGIVAHLKADRLTKFDFLNFWLKERVHKEAARDGGLMSEWEWTYPTVPEDDMGILGDVANKAEERAKFESTPHFVLVRIDKE